MHPVLAILLAVASALAFAASTVGQQRAAARTSDADARSGRFAAQLLRDPRWLAATGGTALGYGLQAAALGLGSVLIVQPILVTSLLFALPLSARLAHVRLPGSVVITGLLLTFSLVVFEVLGKTAGGTSHGSALGWVATAVVAIPLLLACLLVARARTGAARAAALAVTVGLLGGVLAILTKSVVDAGADGVVHLLATGETYGLAVVGLTGIYLQQLSFQAGELQTSLPIMTVLEPVVAAILGVALLHERVPPGSLRLACLIASALVAATATVSLARVQAAGLDAGSEEPDHTQDAMNGERYRDMDH